MMTESSSLGRMQIEDTIELREDQPFTPDLRVFPDGGSFRYLIL
jgi:hypothetical protein